MKKINLIISFILPVYTLFAQVSIESVYTVVSEKFTGYYWEQEGEENFYVGEELFDYINGGADVYLEYGFKQVMVAKYKNGRNKVYIDIYEMYDSSAAFGIFSLSSNCQGEILKDYDNVILFDYYFLIWRNNYFISLTYQDEITYDTNFVVELIDEIENIISIKSEEPAILQQLPNENLKCKKYVRGHLGFNDIYHFDNKNIFLFCEAATGEYENYKIIIMKYFDVKDRIEKYDYSLHCIQNNPKFSNFNILDDKVTFSDMKNNYICLFGLNEYLVIIISQEDDCFNEILNLMNNKIQ
ncbi:MAG: hypothetical protein JXA68_08395 [Ignavibacteriales bacterium]|nr:hypothetical protein [Ignavibacteriales bacterium]